MAAPGTHLGTRSVLFTDLVGSTELRVRVGEDAADLLRRSHDALLADAVTSNGGTVVKGLGDGIMATFESAAEGVAASVAVQQAVDAHGRHEPDRAFSVRVGLSIGDVSSEDGDVFGVPVVEASRLCAAAGGGEVLAAEVVRALARGRGGFTYEPMGDLALKGLAEAVPACRVLWEPLLDADFDDGQRLPIAPALMGALTTTYVGRDALRAELAGAWDAARSGRPRTVLLAGEPGVGKTRTSAELCRTAHAEGALVLFGRCDEALGVPYQPFVEALAHYAGHAPAPTFGRLPGELRRLVPDLGPSVAAPVQPLASDPASEEHRLFEACASWLLTVARASDAGCVLVLDDLHWATKPTLQLLQHVVRAAIDEGAPLLVLATYRDTDVNRAHPLADAIGDLRRLGGVDRLGVDNLSRDEVIAFIAAAAGHELDDGTLRLASAVHAETEGNPFFVGEVLRHLVETGGVRRSGDRWVVDDPDHVSVPEGVRDVVGRRLSRLSDAANAVLSIAAVVGRDFDVEILDGLVGSPEDTTLDALDEAVRARLVEEVGVDRYRFAHALVRTTLYEELSATRRRRLHRQVADVLEALRPEDVRALALHCTEAGPDQKGGVSRALRYTIAAAEDALAARAFADAEVRFRSALELIEEADERGSASWLATRCGLGESLRDQGDPSFRAVLLDASQRALDGGFIDLAVRAALANSRGIASTTSGTDPERIAVLERVLEIVGPTPSQQRSRLLARLGDELTFSGEVERRLRLTDDAVAMARALGDDRLLGDVLVVTGYSSMTGHRAPQLVERNAEAVRLADAHGDPAQRCTARLFSASSALVMGDLEESARTLAELMLIVEVDGAPWNQWGAHANDVRRLSLQGDLDAADALNDEVLRRGQDVGQDDAAQLWGAAAFGHMWLRGNAAQFADAAGEIANEYPLGRVWRCAHAWSLCEAGRFGEARAVVAEHGLDPREFVDDVMPFVATFQLATVAFSLDDPALGALVIEALEPHRDCWAHYFMFVNGPLTWALGQARSATGDLDTAVADFQAALARMEAAGAVAHLPTARVHFARVLRARGADGDGVHADQVLTVARQEAVAIGATGLVEQIDALLVSPGSDRSS